MSEKRQKTQLELAFAVEGKGEAPSPVAEGTETPVAARELESPESTKQLMEEVCERENLKKALKRVQSNRGSPGVDGMTVDELPGYLREHWPTTLRDQLLSGAYVPQAVKRVEIPKPGGGVRRLGVPSALDRFIQQAEPRGSPLSLLIGSFLQSLRLLGARPPLARPSSPVAPAGRLPAAVYPQRLPASGVDAD